MCFVVDKKFAEVCHRKTSDQFRGVRNREAGSIWSPGKQLNAMADSEGDIEHSRFCRRGRYADRGDTVTIVEIVDCREISSALQTNDSSGVTVVLRDDLRRPAWCHQSHDFQEFASK